METKTGECDSHRLCGGHAEILYRLCHECYYLQSLPDVRDGFEACTEKNPVYMYELGIRYDRPYRKCARI